MASPASNTSINLDPPTDSEIAEYGNWLGLSDGDEDLFWIAKQALQTSIPVPWVECQTDEGDIFYYNSNTKESVWDHPYDSYYKAAIGKYKAGQCSKEELTSLVSQEWLLAGTDARMSSTESPRMEGPSGIPRVSTGSSKPRSSTASMEDRSPKLIVTLPMGENENASPSSSMMAPVGSNSPHRNRRRGSIIPKSSSPATSGIDTYSAKYLLAKHEEMKSPSGGLSEVITLREQLASKETEIQSARAQIVHLTGEIESSAKRHKAETDALTSDLIKAREYIEILLGENRSLRARMADAAGRVQKIQLDASGVRQRLNEEANKREAVEAHNRYLEERVRALEIPSPSASGVRGSGLLSKFCGVSCAPATSSRRLSGVRTPVSASRHPNKSSTPATPREDPYRELMTLLASPPSTPTQQKTN